jgi:hypothetical protein
MKSKTLLRVVEMARSGCTDREIGKAVGAAPSTVSYHQLPQEESRNREGPRSNIPHSVHAL